MLFVAVCTRIYWATAIFNAKKEQKTTVKTLCVALIDLLFGLGSAETTLFEAVQRPGLALPGACCAAR